MSTPSFEMGDLISGNIVVGDLRLPDGWANLNRAFTLGPVEDASPVKAAPPDEKAVARMAEGRRQKARRWLDDSSNRVLTRLIERFKTFYVDFHPGPDYTVDDARSPKPADVEDANLLSSIRRDSGSVRRHSIVLDIDYPVHVIPSSTSGHYHLILETPVGIAHPHYMRLLRLLGQYGVIEEGYARASVARGYSAIRLPWVRKGEQA